MENNNTCPRCLREFSSSQRLDTHLKKKIPCQSSDNGSSKVYICQHCSKSFTRNDSLQRHKKNTCPLTKKKCPLKENQPFSQTISILSKQINELREMQSADSKEKWEKLEKQEKEIAELKGKPQINNQILQMICVGSNDNYLDMLTEKWNSFDQALKYIKDCALSSLSGDCKLIEKIYFSSYQPSLQNPPIRFIDKGRTKIEYFNEKNERVVDTKELFCKKIANNLQNSYLKGVNYLINRNLDNNLCPNKFLEEYDLQTWNRDIYELSDQHYQKKIIGQLNIPSN